MTQEQIENLPIDIHSNKLLDWLISRRHCEKQWQKAALVIREKINNAIQDMPAVEEITQLLTGTYINYFHCIKIVELLRETEAGTKNIFGSYSSQRMKDWQEVVKLYEKDGIYLAEAADMLMKNVKYEIPSLKQQIKKCNQTQADCARKEVDYGKTAAEMKEQFLISCRQLGIKGERIKKELVSLLGELPQHYSEMLQDIAKLADVQVFYLEFVTYTLGNNVSSATLDRLPMLKYIMAHGNTTTYEWRTGKKPSRIDEPVINVEEDESVTISTSDQIDFEGTSQINFDSSEEVDFGIELETGAENIDFGIEDAADAEGIDFDAADQITFDITLEDESGTLTLDTKESNEGLATGTDAFLIMDNASTRNLFLDDLYELQVFLSQRLLEMSSEANVLAMSQFERAPLCIQSQTTEQLQHYLAAVDGIILQLTSGKMQHLFLIKSSPRYVDRLAESLKQKCWQADKMIQSQKLMVRKQKESRREQEALEPKLALIHKRTKELQQQIQGEISKKYKNRPVNLVGEINII
ncbi:PREDICTED: CDK5 regulatory subunit-associated protein 3-like isoform X3 [Priapulus caudatus]|nr:PREDICTED: CDK5 regulatory subunit-associated protein 3-like isoform X3 [Priapulus caudatus]XP_014666359.1 PREDICTED: CDK5 regulatory subunit-associated protein 3-like isoform X3 [Priapulus caudatus]